MYYHVLRITSPANGSNRVPVGDYFAFSHAEEAAWNEAQANQGETVLIQTIENEGLLDTIVYANGGSNA